jgi:hypothetical protein
MWVIRTNHPFAERLRRRINLRSHCQPTHNLIEQIASLVPRAIGSQPSIPTRNKQRWTLSFSHVDQPISERLYVRRSQINPLFINAPQPGRNPPRRGRLKGTALPKGRGLIFRELHCIIIDLLGRSVSNH